MSVVSNAFTAIGNGSQILVSHGQTFTYQVTGTFVGTWIIEKSFNGGTNFVQIATGTGVNAAPISVLIESPDRANTLIRARCSAYTSGTMTVALESIETTNSYAYPAANSTKVGTTAGWVTAAADNIALVTLPASQTASTAVLSIPRLRTGQKIVAFYLVGQIESAGGSVSIAADLRKMTAAAADVVDASIGANTALVVTADTIMSATNTRKALAPIEVVGNDESFYVLITATTAAVTDIALQGVVLEIID